MAIRITEDGVVNYENSPDVNRKLFPNLNICGKAIDEVSEEIDGKAPAVFSTASGSIASFNDGADNMSLKSCVVSFEPIQGGEGDPSPENVRPISGRAGLSVTRCGKNLLKWSNQSTTIRGVTFTVNADDSILCNGTATDGDASFYSQTPFDVPIKPGDYILSGCPVGGSSTTFLLNETQYGKSEYGNGAAINATTAKSKIRVRIVIRNGYTADNLLFKPMLRLSSEADATFEPYKGTTYSVNWEAEAGTVYGATLDVVSGKLTIDKAIIVYTGDSAENWQWDSTNSRGYIEVPNCAITASRTPVICNIGKYAATGVNVGDVFISSQNNSLYYVPSATVTDLTAFKEFLAETNMQVVYNIAEPIEYQLESQEIRTLLGENNIWSKDGDVSVEYPVDTKTYIDDLSIKTVEVTGQTPVITAEENTRYICGEVTSLKFTPCEKMICDVRFTAASISTVLTLPETVKLPEWFDPTLLEAGTTYEINILDGIYGVVMSWA